MGAKTENEAYAVLLTCSTRCLHKDASWTPAPSDASMTNKLPDVSLATPAEITRDHGMERTIAKRTWPQRAMCYDRPYRSWLRTHNRKT